MLAFPLIDTKENVQGVAEKTERRLHRRKGISLVFCPSPFPSPQLFSPRVISFHFLPPTSPLPPLPLPPILHELRSIFVQSADKHAPSSPCTPFCPPLSLDHGYRLGSDNLTIANLLVPPSPPANLLRIFNCIPTWNGREKTSLAFHPLLSALHCSPFFLFRETATSACPSSSSSFSSSSLFHLPSTCNLVGTHVMMVMVVVENSKDRPPLGSMLASNLHVLSPRYRVWLTKREQKKMCTGWISAKTRRFWIPMPRFFDSRELDL